MRRLPTTRAAGVGSKVESDLEAQDVRFREIATGAPCRHKQNLKKIQHETTEVRSLLDQFIIDGAAEQWARLRAVGETLGS